MCPKRNKQRCRLCLGMSLKYVDVLLKDKYDIIQKISDMFAFKITTTDVFTSKICNECIKNVREIYIFFEKVKNSQIYLQNELLKMGKSEEILNEDKILSIYPSDEREQELTEIAENTNSMSNYIYEMQIKVEISDNDLTKKDEVDAAELSNNDFDSEDDTKLIFLNKKSLSKTKKKINKKTNQNRNIYNCEKNIIESNAKPEDEYSLDDIENIESVFENISDTNETETDFNIINKDTPVELFKNGKLVIKGKTLDKLMANFYKLKCTLCEPSPEFDILDLVFKHYEIEHKSKGFVTCCNQKLFRRKAAFDHMRKHVQPLAFQCPICKKVLSRPYLLKEHLASHLPESEKPRKCTQCDRRYTCYSGLKNHMLTHLPKEKRDVFTCSQCDKQFSNKSSFKMHLMNVHTTAQHLCAVCGKKFKTKPNLAYHLTTHDDEMKMCCKECGFIAKNKLTLKNHLVTHSNIVLQCDKCEYTTTLKRSLWSHIKMKHSEDKPFQCTFCEKRYKTKNLLESHTVQHTGERKFSCKYCPKTFASSGNKSTHIKRMHSIQLEQEAKIKQQMYHSVLEVQLLQEREEVKSQELARQHLKELESAFRNPILTGSESMSSNKLHTDTALVN